MKICNLKIELLLLFAEYYNTVYLEDYILNQYVILFVDEKTPKFSMPIIIYYKYILFWNIINI